ncbi:MAG TPA: hypothetical protein VF170_17885 [Planctomycetaceae bacterium]
MRRFTILSLAFASLRGCDTAAPPSQEPRPNAVIEREASWEELVAAVRSGKADEIRLSGPVTPEQFRDLATGCEGLTALVLGEARVRDEDLDVLPALPRLRWLKLPAPVGDEGAAAIARCESLEILNLPEGVFSDAGLSEIAGLERLSLLRFGSPNVTDDGLKELARLPRLKFLHLLGVPVTDAGLKHVAAIGTLESFYLDGGRATDDGLRALLGERPDLHFHKDQHHLPGDPNAHRHE